MRLHLVLLPLAAMAVSGCVGNRYCLGEQKYQKAPNLAPLTPVEGLKLPESPTALRIPPPPPAVVPFGVRSAKGDGVCLDKPPPMQSPAEPVPPAKG